MRNKTYLLALIIIIVSSFNTFGSANFEITPDIDTMIPENTLMYIQISNPEDLMLNIDKFLSKTGISAILGNVTLKDNLTKLLESEEAGISLDYFNLTHPIGLAVLPPVGKSSESEDVEFIVFLPINNTLDMLKIINKPSDSYKTLYTIFMNYLVYFSSKELKENFPSKNIIDLSVLDKYNKDSLSIYYDIQGLYETFGAEVPTIINELENNTSNDLAIRIFKGYFEIFNKIDSLFSNIEIDRKGILLQSDMIFSEEIKPLFSFSDNLQNIQKWEPYLPEKSFLQGIYSLNSKDYSLVIDKVINYIFPEIENNPMMIELKEYLEFTTKYTGNGGAFSLDISPIVSKTEDQTFPFDISYSTVSELTDSETFLKEFRDFYSSQSINNILNSLYKDSGFKIQLKMEENKLNGNSPVFKFTYEIRERRTKSRKILNEIDPGISFLNNIEFWYYIEEGKMYSYMGSKGIEGLKELILPNKNAKEWIRNAPNNSNLIWNLSLTNVVKLFEILPEFNPENKLIFDISGFTSNKNGSMQSTAYISSEDIGNLYNLYKDIEF